MTTQAPFKWRHFEAEIILLCVRWYLRYALSYRDLEEMMAERGLHVDHTTIYRWVQRYVPELEKRCRPHLKATMDSWRVDETYVKVKEVWTYLYRAVDSHGNTLEFHLSATRDAQAAMRFLTKALGACHTVTPRVITVDKNAAYPKFKSKKKGIGSFRLTGAIHVYEKHVQLPRLGKLRLKECGSVIDQDHNAAINLALAEARITMR